MKRSHLLLAAALAATFAGAGAWLAFSTAPHEHVLEPRTGANGETYYTCAMHPEVRRDAPGNCPICGMALIRGKATPRAADGERRVLYWYDPMKPEVHFDQPGKSPFMDMDLLPRYADADAAGAPGAGGIVQIDPRMVQNLGIRTAPVTRGTFWQRVDATGSVDVDERRIVVVEARAAGWVEDLRLRAVGDPVRRGQLVAGVYSPELYAAQQELALAAASGDAALLGAARQRALLLGLTPGQVEDVVRRREARRHVAVLAPSDGVVTELNVREGQQVMPGTPLMRIADLSRLWVTVEIPESQGAWLREGRPAEARLAALPGRVFEGTVEYIYPRLEAQTRTVRARIALDNPELALKPGMYADVALFGGPRADTLLVPSEAVIRTGERSVVILAEGEGRFRPAQVEVGDDRAGQTEIRAGLAEGETVVVSGQFLIDSEANLRAVLSRIAAPAAHEDAPPAHEGHAP